VVVVCGEGKDTEVAVEGDEGDGDDKDKEDVFT
jgi:hypothetical protein